MGLVWNSWKGRRSWSARSGCGGRAPTSSRGRPSWWVHAVAMSAETTPTGAIFAGLYAALGRAEPVAGDRAQPRGRRGDARRTGGGTRAHRRAGCRRSAGGVPPLSRSPCGPVALERPEAAGTAYQAALERATNPVERRFLERRLAEVAERGPALADGAAAGLAVGSVSAGEPRLRAEARWARRTARMTVAHLASRGARGASAAHTNPGTAIIQTASSAFDAEYRAQPPAASPGEGRPPGQRFNRHQRREGKPADRPPAAHGRLCDAGHERDDHPSSSIIAMGQPMP